MPSLRRRVDNSFKSLNDLASATFVSAIEPDLPLTSTQQWIMDDVARRVQRHGDPPLEMTEELIYADMAKRASLYSLGGCQFSEL